MDGSSLFKFKFLTLSGFFVAVVDEERRNAVYTGGKTLSQKTSVSYIN